MPRDIRRVITGHDDDGKAVIMIDETITPDIGHVLPPPARGTEQCQAVGYLAVAHHPR